MDLNFNVNNQIVTRTDNQQVVNMSENYLKLIFNFETEDWTDLTDYYIVFKADDGDYRFELIRDTSVQGLSYYIMVPSLFLTGKKFIFGLVGEEGNSVRITTNLIMVHLLDSKFTGGGLPILEKFNELSSISDDLQSKLNCINTLILQEEDILSFLEIPSDDDWLEPYYNQEYNQAFFLENTGFSSLEEILTLYLQENHYDNENSIVFLTFINPWNNTNMLFIYQYNPNMTLQCLFQVGTRNY